MHTNHLRDDDCFALRLAARHISKLYERYLSRAGITPTQFNILRTLSRCPASTMAELSTAMLLDRTTLVRALQPLLRDGLAAAHAEKQGNRLRVVLTESGSTRLDEAAVLWRAAQASFERSFGRQEAARLRDELFRMTTDPFDK